MKKLIKRYRFFLLLLSVNIAVGIMLPEVGLKSLELTKQNIIEMVLVIPPIFILLGLLDVWIDRATMMKYTGKGSGLKGILLAFLLGAAAAGPLYAAFPVASVMLKKGSSFYNVFIFIGAWSTAKIPMLTFEAANLGVEFTLTRLTLSITGIIIIATITGKALSKAEQDSIRDLKKT